MRCTTIAATVLLVLWSASNAICDEIKDVMDQALATVRCIESFECNTSLSYSNGKVTTVKMACDGIRFFFDYADIVPPQKLGATPHVEGYDPLKPFKYKLAFNGANYQLRIEGSGLTSDRPQKPFLMQPLMLPCLWLVFDGGNEPRLETLRSDATWAKRFEQATLIGQSQVREEPCTVLAFPQLSGQANTVYHVHFAKNLGGFPMRYERIANDSHAVSSRCDVSKIHAFKVNGREAYFPIQVKYEETGLAKDHSMPGEITVDVAVESLHINERIDEAIFTLPLQIK